MRWELPVTGKRNYQTYSHSFWTHHISASFHIGFLSKCNPPLPWVCFLFVSNPLSATCLVFSAPPRSLQRRHTPKLHVWLCLSAHSLVQRILRGAWLQPPPPTLLSSKKIDFHFQVSFSDKTLIFAWRRVTSEVDLIFAATSFMDQR